MSLLFLPTVSQHVPNPGVARIFISQVQEGRDRRLRPSIFPLFSLAPPHHPLLACADVPAFDPDPRGQYHHLPSSLLVGQPNLMSPFFHTGIFMHYNSLCQNKNCWMLFNVTPAVASENRVCLLLHLFTDEC